MGLLGTATVVPLSEGLGIPDEEETEVLLL